MYSNGLRALNKRLNNLMEFAIEWMEASLCIKLYSVAMMTAIAWVIGAVIEPQRPLTGPLSLALLGVAAIASGLSLLIEIHAWATRLKTWQEASWLVRGTFAGLLTMALAFSAAYASTLVNEITGAPPSLFPYTTAFLTPLAALAVLLMVVMVVYVLVFAHAFVMGTLSMLMGVMKIILPKFKTKAARWVTLVISMRLLGVFALASGILQIIPWYETALKSIGWLFAVRYEMYAHDPCVRNTELERLIHSDDETVLVVSRDQSFMTPLERRRCPKTTGLAPASGGQTPQ
jgi:hypothetical protein